MDINGWLTIITVYTAIFALLPREELVLFLQRIKHFEKWTILLTIVFVVPALILFPKFLHRWPSLSSFGFSWGFEPENIAFALFFASFVWFLLRLFYIKPQGKPSKKHIEYYFELLNEKSFDEFFRIFTKYTSPHEIDTNWTAYKRIFFQPKFLNGVFVKQTTYLLRFWDKFSDEQDFKAIFRLFLEDQNSAYYNEIREQNGSIILASDKPFLNKILKDNIQKSIHFYLLPIFSDFALRHLRSEHNKDSVYNKPHHYYKISEEEGYDLPIYYHILFIGLLYTHVIRNKIDVQEISFRNGNMFSIYSTMIEEIVNNMPKGVEDSSKEYPTNYHWLIGKVFEITYYLGEDFSINHYSNLSSYNSFIPFSFSACIEQLYKACDFKKISEEFLAGKIYHYPLSLYFNPQVNVDFKSKIETEIIAKIPERYLRKILEFALNEKYAIQLTSFMQGRFNFVNDTDKAMLERLHKFLQGQNMIP